ncbi:AMP-dependent synthetase and ligase [Thermocrinis albus DSM 14484]|uniref:AMP-dependent synthetase and ligase n=1 Tax=Thermocrinis albus (strain DSM 14484 / JCM 11386 / HI 11/12) TaxID=638303 RepID=D3SPB4_THEAH|nr:AMP-binding protein [Thermocrinis albus]ADC89001.1 AMP-dependent synthetase and ligase [Thermocrinis albus DSM 14484]
MRLDLENGFLVPEVRDFGKTALVQGEREISYAELIENSRAFASLLDVLPEDRVVIFMENRAEWVYALFSIWQRGAIAVPVDFMSSPEDLQLVLTETEPAVVYCSERTEGPLKQALSMTKVSPHILNVDTLIPPKPVERIMHRNLQDVALILYTSGTTGKPKGVMLTFKNILSNIRSVEKLKMAGSEDSTLALLPFHHAYPLVVSLLLPLYLGATIVFLERLSTEDLMRTMQRHRITVLIGVPRLYQVLHARIMERVKASAVGRFLFLLSPYLPMGLRKLLFRRVHSAFGGNLRYMVSGGAALPLQVAKDLTYLGFTVLEGYGLTETSPIVSFNPPHRIKLGSVGTPIEEVYVKIAPDGEVLVRGVNVMKGYYKRPEDTKKAFVDGWFMTGDLGYLDQDGYLYITGRKKEIIVLPDGKKVNPEELEDLILRESPVVKEVGVLEMEGVLHALLVPDMEKVKQMGIVNLEEYIRWNVLYKVNRKLPEWKRIGGFKLTTEELPRTRLGKLKRFLLYDLYRKAGEITEREEDDTMRTEEAELIREFLTKLSGRKVMGHHHIELDLGLDSLAKVELLSFLEMRFGVEMEEEELSRYSKVRDLVNYVRERKEGLYQEEIGWQKILTQAPSFLPYHNGFLMRMGLIPLKAYFKLYHRLEVEGTENFPEGPFIIAPNHASYLDGFAIASALPWNVLERTYFVGEETYFKGPLRQAFAKLAHIVPVDPTRRVKESLQKAAWLLRLGKVVVIFPEGARTRDGKLLPFKKGFAILSKELSVPVVPTALIGTYEAMSWRDKFPKPYPIKVIFGKPIQPDGKGYEEIVRETEYTLRTMLLQV